MKNKPLGGSSLSEIIANDQFYVDKTALASKLLFDARRRFLLARPDGFGKTLFIDTLQLIFEAKKELFKGLYIYDHWDWSTSYPVIRLNLGVSRCPDEEGMVLLLKRQLLKNERKFDFQSEDSDVLSRFSDLICLLSKKYKSKVVILIDDYDRPVLDNFTGNHVALIRDMLSSFYGIIDDNREYVKLCFMTGISSLDIDISKIELNGFYDISLDADYSEVCGFTENEITPWLRSSCGAGDTNTAVEDYCAYQWNGAKVCRPVDFSGLVEMSFNKAHWFFKRSWHERLSRFIKSSQYVPDLMACSVNEQVLLSGEMSTIKFLYLYGILVNKGTREGVLDSKNYIFGFPSKQVEYSFNSEFFSILVGDFEWSCDLREKLVYALKSKMLKEMQEIFDEIFFAYNAKHQYQSGCYISLLYVVFASLGLGLVVETTERKKYVDLMIELDEVLYIISIQEDAGFSGVDPITRLINNRYAEKYIDKRKDIFFVGFEMKNKCPFECIFSSEIMNVF
ncbi:MAG: AAA family ATPase [Hahellaceae bacterium]|nr:AAA family ATPase [Hahellaceae bacterium]